MSLAFDKRFFRAHPVAAGLLELFENIPEVIFFAKDRSGRFVAANSTMLATKDIREPSELLGRTDKDFNPPVFADAYIAEDRTVMESGAPIANQSWFVIDRVGRPGWFRCSKVPMFSMRRRVIGVAGVRYAVSTPEDRVAQFRNLAAAVQYLEDHFAETVPTEELAALAGVSVTQFNRRFSEIFRQSPRQFLLSLRIEKARHRLSTTEMPVVEISVETGFYDQSHFTRHFRRFTGLTPTQYRRQYQTAK